MGIAQEKSLTLVALSGANLVVSWSLDLATPASEQYVFLIPPMIAGHLLTALPRTADVVELVLGRGEASLLAEDEMGLYELRWRFELHRFPAPPDMGRLLALPSRRVRLDYLQVADSFHQAVARLGIIEAQQRIHRTRLAVLIGLPQGQLVVSGQEIGAQTAGKYYFDPRLLIRALECVHAGKVEVGLSDLNTQHGFLSVVDRQPDYVMHCALLSIGLNMPWLLPLHRDQDQANWLERASLWKL